MGLGGRLGSIWQSGGPACGAWMRNQPITPDKLLMARRPRSRPTLVSGTMRKCVVFAPPLLDRSTGQHTALGATALRAPHTSSWSPVPGVTTGTLRPELACIGVPTTHSGSERDWALTGWGNRTDKDVTMPLRGRALARTYSGAEAEAAAHAPILGATMLDIGMNEASFWRGVPEQVWDCRIGDYQVLKKWLSYRDHSIIARPLSAEKVGHVQQVARRIAMVLLLGPELDASYQDCVQAHA